MPRRLTFLPAPIIALAILCIPGSSGFAFSQPSAPADAFLARHREEVARNRFPGLFSIRFQVARSTYQPGEPISIELIFRDSREATIDAGVSGETKGWPNIEVVSDRREDVSTPTKAMEALADFNKWKSSVFGGLPGYDGQPPQVLRFTVNSWVRFDAPGEYRLFIRSRHLAKPGQEPAAGPFGTPTTRPTETSNILELEIAPRDRAWEDETVKQAVEVLDDVSGARRDPTKALQTLMLLGSDAAAVALAHRFASITDIRLREIMVRGLFAARDRELVVRLLQDEIRDPMRPVDGELVRALAKLEATRRHPDGTLPTEAEYLALVEQYSSERAQALEQVPGRLHEVLRREFADYQWDGFTILDSALAAALHHIPEATADALRSMDDRRQVELLTWSWRRFRFAEFLPMLRERYMAAHRLPALRDIALRRWHELRPEEARDAILHELADPTSPVSIDTLGGLPHATLPEFDSLWLRQLQSVPTYALTPIADRIERYASAAIASEVLRHYRRIGDRLPCAAHASLLAYLGRTTPERAEKEIGRRLARSARTKTSDCHYELLGDIAEYEWSPAIEAAAIQALAIGHDSVAGNAARTLGLYGSPAARQPLTNRLRRLQAALKGHLDPDEYSSSAFLERELVRALAAARVGG